MADDDGMDDVTSKTVFSLSAGIPEVIHGLHASVNASYERERIGRRRRFWHGAQDRSGLDEAELLERLAAPDAVEVRALASRAGARAEDEPSDEYADLLGRLVGAALDPALVSEADLLLAEVLKLDAAQLRLILRVAARFTKNTSEGVVTSEPNEAQATWLDQFDIDAVTSALSVSRWAAYSMVTRLTGAAFLYEESVEPTTTIMVPDMDLGPHRRWRLSSWGVEALHLVFPNLVPPVPDQP